MKRNVRDEQGNPKIEYYGYCIDLMDLVQKKMDNGSDPWKFSYSFYEGKEILFMNFTFILYVST